MGRKQMAASKVAAVVGAVHCDVMGKAANKNDA